MRHLIRPAVVALLAFASTSVACAESLTLDGDRFWVGVASSRDRDVAIGIARLFQSSSPRVVLAKNGWYAVILGPVHTRSISDYRSTYQGWPPLPSDALVSRGNAYTDTIWQPSPSPLVATETAEEGHPAILRANGLEVTVSFVGATLRIKGDDGLDLVAPMSPGEGFASTSAALMWLDKRTQAPQIVVTQYSGGAHCCTSTLIATETQAGKWVLVDGLIDLDGDGYGFEDIDYDGVYELISSDNSFLYAFDSYAGSFAPVKITRVVDGHAVDATTEPLFRQRLAQDLAQFEFLARQDPTLWRANGFLAGWVAAKARLNQLNDAWQIMLTHYDRNPDFGEQVCVTGGPVEQCPSGDLRTLPFPDGLALHLQRYGYGPLPHWLPEVDPRILALGSDNSAPAPERQAVAPTPSRATVPPSDSGSSGSGFFVGKGLLLTNAHVVKDCSSISVSIGGTTSSATVLARDEINDLAVVRTDASSPLLAKLRRGVKLGEEVSVFGFPLNGLLASGGNFTRGNVTATAGLADDSRYVQISDPVQPGNSGGPLLDESGNVVGIVASKLNVMKLATITEDLAQNVNFAIKTSAIESFLEANGVAYEAGDTATRLDAPDVAAMAQQFTAIVACNQ